MERTMTEDDLQKAVATYLDAVGLTWCHVPNEGKRNTVAGKRLKAKGMKAGVPDCLIFNTHGEYDGMAIELKVGRNNQTDTQSEWELKLINCGWSYHVCRSLDEVIELIKINYRK
jgi:hypothetical protein